MNYSVNDWAKMTHIGGWGLDAGGQSKVTTTSPKKN